MGSKLWFLTDGVKVLSVFDNRRAAEREIERFQDDPDYEYYSVYGIDLDDLEDYPDECDMAMEEGFI